MKGSASQGKSLFVVAAAGIQRPEVSGFRLRVGAWKVSVNLRDRKGMAWDGNLIGAGSGSARQALLAERAC